VNAIDVSALGDIAFSGQGYDTASGLYNSPIVGVYSGLN
jgi:hypothetical protein